MGRRRLAECADHGGRVVVVMLEQVSAHCWVRQSGFCRSNTVVVAGEEGALVVDPGVTGAELGKLVEEREELGLTPTMGFSTHPHWDHMLWVRGLGDGPRWATRALWHMLGRTWRTRARRPAGWSPATSRGWSVGSPASPVGR